MGAGQKYSYRVDPLPQGLGAYDGLDWVDQWVSWMGMRRVRQNPPPSISRRYSVQIWTLKLTFEPQVGITNP